MSGRDACLVAGTVAVCGIFGYLWTKRQTGLTATPATLSQSNSSSRNSAQDIHNNAEEYARLDCNDLEEDRIPFGEWIDAVILHASDDEPAARSCQKILMKEIKVPNLQISLPDDIITPGSPTLDGLGSLLTKCRLVIIFHTRMLSTDGIMLFGKQASIVQSLEDPHKRNRIVPLVVDDEDIPVDMSTIQPMNYVSDIGSDNFTIFKDKMEKLILMWREKIA